MIRILISSPGDSEPLALRLEDTVGKPPSALPGGCGPNANVVLIVQREQRRLSGEGGC